MKWKQRDEANTHTHTHTHTHTQWERDEAKFMDTHTHTHMYTVGARRSQVHGRLRRRSVGVAEKQQIQRLLFVYVYVCVYVCMYVCMCMYVGIVSVCVHVCMCVYTSSDVVWWAERLRRWMLPSSSSCSTTFDKFSELV